MASVISNGGGYYSAFGYLSEARRMGLEILPPHINESEIKYTGKNREIRVGLIQLKEISKEAVEFVVQERSKHGPFASLESFLFRTQGHVHLQDVRVLIKAGCFDSVAHSATRPALMWQALRFFDTPAPQVSLPLFQSSLLPPFTKGGPGGISFSPYPRSLVLKHEIETLGFLLSIHPLDRHSNILKRLSYVPAKNLHRHVGRHVTMVGWMVTGKTVHTRDGDPMKFVSFEDTTGLYEAVFFPKVYNRFCHMLNEMRPYILKGKVEEDYTAVTLTVHWIQFLDRNKQLNHLLLRSKRRSGHA
jgi:error-prone DNA polymerase